MLSAPLDSQMSEVSFEFVEGVIDLFHGDVGHPNGPERTRAKRDRGSISPTDGGDRRDGE